jgi:hypothetical protein
VLETLSILELNRTLCTKHRPPTVASDVQRELKPYEAGPATPLIFPVFSAVRELLDERNHHRLAPQGHRPADSLSKTQP